VILGLALAAAAIAAPPTTAVIGTPPQPGWNALGAQQQAILAPLAPEWDTLDNIGRKKWLGIAERYPRLSRDEQTRVQERMREWARLSPEQRAKARDTYKEFNQLPGDQKDVVKQKWEAYANLPAEDRQRLRQEGKSSRLLAPPVVSELPPGAGAPAPSRNSTLSAPADTAAPGGNSAAPSKPGKN
jgi:hypothetical protein